MSAGINEKPRSIYERAVHVARVLEAGLGVAAVGAAASGELDTAGMFVALILSTELSIALGPQEQPPCRVHDNSL